MKPELQILFVEDREVDAAKAADLLRRHGFKASYRRVESAEEMSNALHAGRWDLVISDYSMPNFNGAEALKLFREARQDIPFIFVSRSLGEERAVEMMRAGAHDYIVKDNLTRLGASVARELEAAKLRRENRRMQDAAAHLAAVVNSSDEAIHSKTLNGVVMTWNKAAERIYGYSAQEMIGHPITTIIPPDRLVEFDTAMDKISRGEHVQRFETVRRTKSGRLIDVSISISPILGTSGEVIGASTIARDITERCEEERDRLKLIDELTEALSHAKTLRSLLPICSGCKKIRDDHGYWQKLESYFEAHQHVDFSHSLCPDCIERLYPDFAEDVTDGSPPDHVTSPAAEKAA